MAPYKLKKASPVFLKPIPNSKFNLLKTIEPSDDEKFKVQMVIGDELLEVVEKQQKMTELFQQASSLDEADIHKQAFAFDYAFLQNNDMDQGIPSIF